MSRHQLSGSLTHLTPLIDPDGPITKDHIGTPVCISGSQIGILRFFGRTKFQDGDWCGIECEKAVGKNDGSVDGVRYFRCNPRCGIFAPVSKVSVVKGLASSVNPISSHVSSSSSGVNSIRSSTSGSGSNNNTCNSGHSSGTGGLIGPTMYSSKAFSLEGGSDGDAEVEFESDTGTENTGDSQPTSSTDLPARMDSPFRRGHASISTPGTIRMSTSTNEDDNEPELAVVSHVNSVGSPTNSSMYMKTPGKRLKDSSKLSKELDNVSKIYEKKRRLDRCWSASEAVQYAHSVNLEREPDKNPVDSTRERIVSCSTEDPMQVHTPPKNTSYSFSSSVPASSTPIKPGQFILTNDSESSCSGIPGCINLSGQSDRVFTDSGEENAFETHIVLDPIFVKGENFCGEGSRKNSQEVNHETMLLASLKTDCPHTVPDDEIDTVSEKDAANKEIKESSRRPSHLRGLLAALSVEECSEAGIVGVTTPELVDGLSSAQSMPTSSVSSSQEALDNDYSSLGLLTPSRLHDDDAQSNDEDIYERLRSPSVDDVEDFNCELLNEDYFSSALKTGDEKTLREVEIEMEKPVDKPVLEEGRVPVKKLDNEPSVSSTNGLKMTPAVMSSLTDSLLTCSSSSDTLTLMNASQEGVVVEQGLLGSKQRLSKQELVLHQQSVVESSESDQVEKTVSNCMDDKKLASVVDSKDGMATKENNNQVTPMVGCMLYVFSCKILCTQYYVCKQAYIFHTCVRVKYYY